MPHVEASRSPPNEHVLGNLVRYEDTGYPEDEDEDDPPGV
jgi:hypothetical protein